MVKKSHAESAVSVSFSGNRENECCFAGAGKSTEAIEIELIEKGLVRSIFSALMQHCIEETS